MNLNQIADDLMEEARSVGVLNENVPMERMGLTPPAYAYKFWVETDAGPAWVLIQKTLPGNGPKLLTVPGLR